MENGAVVKSLPPLVTGLFWPRIDATQMFKYIDKGQPMVCDFALQWLLLQEEKTVQTGTAGSTHSLLHFFSSVLTVFHQHPYLINLLVNGFSVPRKDYSEVYMSLEYFSEVKLFLPCAHSPFPSPLDFVSLKEIGTLIWGLLQKLT